MSLALASLTACQFAEGGRHDGDEGALQCADQRYGDGTCNLDLACGAPDLDCFHFFDSDQAAADYVLEMMMASGMEGQVVPGEHPSYQRMRGLLDEAWEVFTREQPLPLGALAQRTPQLAVLAMGEANAMAAPYIPEGDFADTSNFKSTFMVIVSQEMIESVTDDAALIAVLTHELSHALRLHTLPSMGAAVNKAYVASTVNGLEMPFAFQAAPHTEMASWITKWKDEAASFGFLTEAELQGWPMDQSWVASMWRAAIKNGNGEACLAGKAALKELVGELDPNGLAAGITSKLVLDASQQARLSEALSQAKTCVAADASLVQLHANVNGLSEEDAAAQLSPEFMAPLAGLSVADAILKVQSSGRVENLIPVQQGFQTAFGVPWSRLRYYSPEDNADDDAYTVMKNSRFGYQGFGNWLTSARGDYSAQCMDLIARGEVPAYGPINDEHHSDCYRAYHFMMLDRTNTTPRTPLIKVMANARSRATGGSKTKPFDYFLR